MQTSSGRAVPAHWLRPNEGSRSPHRCMFVDTETRPELVGREERHTLRWWHARVVRRHVDNPRAPVLVDLAGDTIESLAEQVDQAAIAKHSLWLYTHNLGFDLQVTGLPEMLFRRGWSIVDLGIAGRSPWLRMANGRRRIVMSDSGSWLPAPLAEIGELVGIPKPVIDDWSTASDEDIAIRCLADVTILSDAMLALMQWWDDNDMGRWQWTGPGCGWAVFRHKYLNSRILMDPDDPKIALERQAIYGGRREAYRIGDLGPGHYADLDFEAAYPSIASRAPLPRKAIARVPNLTMEAYAALPTDWGVLSECTVTTTVPVVPCRVDRHTLYPVGTFKTVLAGPDIKGAIEVGATVRLGDTVIYQMEPFLKDWGQWITGVIDGTGEQVPPVVRMTAKHWSRTVIGRFAMHAQRVEDWGEACWPMFHAEPMTDLDTGNEVIDLHACGRHMRIYRDAEPENVFPAVTAWIEAECRQLLRRAMAQCPAGSVVQCDTDGFMLAFRVEGEAASGPVGDDSFGGEGSPEEATGGPPVPELVDGIRVRVKGLYRQATLLGPQQVILGESRRISGVPRAFTSTDGLTYTGWSWPGYTWQLAKSQPGVYTRPHVTVALRGPYGSRWLLENGSTMAPYVSIINGHNIIRPPSPKAARKEGGKLARIQPAILAPSR